MGVEQPWEALDVDDSDLPSLLRPCKYQKTSLTIPGPAGAVKSAMLRKTLDHQNLNSCADDLPSTQEYVRKAVEDTIEFDDDFTALPWVSALQYLGVGEGASPISSIKKCTDVGVADQVVAVIKSCQSSGGVGGMIVTLKDPTGTIGASIHHKVLCESEFRKKITVGSVLILHKVAVFSPVRSSQYLNITLRNLVKVIGQGADPSSNGTYVDNPTTTDYPGKANASEVSPMECTLIEDTRLNKGKDKLIQKQNLFSRSSKSDDRTSSNLNVGVKRSYVELSQDLGLEASQGESPADRQRFVLDNDKCTEGDVLNSIHLVTNSVANKGKADESQGANEVNKERQSLISKASLPQWTDEQLEELFADDEEGGSLF